MRTSKLSFVKNFHVDYQVERNKYLMRTAGQNIGLKFPVHKRNFQLIIDENLQMPICGDRIVEQKHQEESPS